MPTGPATAAPARGDRSSSAHPHHPPTHPPSYPPTHPPTNNPQPQFHAHPPAAVLKRSAPLAFLKLLVAFPRHFSHSSYPYYSLHKRPRRDPVTKLPFEFVLVADFSPFAVRAEAFKEVGAAAAAGDSASLF